MELDDLKSYWKAQAYDRTETLLTVTARSATARQLNPLRLGTVTELIFNAAVVIAFGSFFGDHLGEPRFAIPAAIAGAFAVVLCVALGRELALMRSLDRGASVVAVLRRLERLKMLRICATIGTLAFAPLMWVPIAIVASKALFGFDFYVFGWPWLVANAVFGIVWIAVVLLVARSVSAKMRGSARVSRIVSDLSGTSLRQTAAMLNALRRFESEEA